MAAHVIMLVSLLGPTHRTRLSFRPGDKAVPGTTHPIARTEAIEQGWICKCGIACPRDWHFQFRYSPWFMSVGPFGRIQQTLHFLQPYMNRYRGKRP